MVGIGALIARIFVCLWVEMGADGVVFCSSNGFGFCDLHGLHCVNVFLIVKDGKFKQQKHLPTGYA